MPELTATPTLGGYSRAFGNTTLAEPTGLAIVSIATPLGGDAALDKALISAFGSARPNPGASAPGKDGARLVWTAPDQMFVLFAHAGANANAAVQGRIKGAGYTTDQTDVWVALDLAGPLARTALERLCPLDLHADAFAIDAAARTVMEHMGAIIIRTGDDAFRLMSASSSAGSFLHAVETSLNYVS